MANVRAVGSPENESERKAINYFAERLPDDYTIFHNLELPTASGFPYEYDQIIVGEHAVYVVEVKGYQGLIRGNAQEWELESGAIRKSPIPLNNKKAKIVGDRLQRRNRVLADAWIQPLVVLTDDRARVQLNDDQANCVLRLDEAVGFMVDPRALPVRTDPLGTKASHIRDAIINQFRPLRRQHEIGDYRVLETISKNNLYTTLLAEHRMLRMSGRFVLKVYHFNIYASDAERQKQEEWITRDANALHQIAGHPNIVRAMPPFPWEDNQRVLPLEWIDGYSLRGLLDTHTSITFSEKVGLVRQICEGLRHAHAHGVLHRDMRPDNVIVPRGGPLKIVNFDCSRIEGEDLPTIASRVGRHLDQRYVAPEVWNEPGAVSRAADIYATGVILFELLTGQVPYSKIRDVFNASGLPKLPRQIDTSLPVDVDEVVRRMCAFDPGDRYPSLDEAIEDLMIIG